jgi:hypothetical protein
LNDEASRSPILKIKNNHTVNCAGATTGAIVAVLFPVTTFGDDIAGTFAKPVNFVFSKAWKYSHLVAEILSVTKDY